MLFDFQKILKSFSYAFNGIISAIKSEQNLRIHIVAAIFVIITGFYLSFSAERWGIVIVSIFFVFVSELWNTAIEKLCNKISNGEKSKDIGIIKDISAGSVFLSALSALIIGIIFIVIPLVKKIMNIILK